jgi:hypothetical protein
MTDRTRWRPYHTATAVRDRGSTARVEYDVRTVVPFGGTEISNPSSSSGESGANLISGTNPIGFRQRRAAGEVEDRPNGTKAGYASARPMMTAGSPAPRYEPGGICVSRVVRDQLRGKLNLGFEQSVKNIAKPVRAFTIAATAGGRSSLAASRARGLSVRTHIVAAAAVAILAAAAGGGWWVWFARHAEPMAVSSPTQPFSAPRLSIVVLPFANLSNDR